MKNTNLSKDRVDWQTNHQLICNAFYELLALKQKVPSYAAIAEQCQLSEKTVERHLQELTFDDFAAQFRPANEQVLVNLFQQASTTKDNHHMIRLWFEVIEKLGSKKQVDITSNGQKLKEGNHFTIDPSNLSTQALQEILQQASHEE